MIPIFNVALISDKDENAILFHLSKYSHNLYDNIVCKMQIEMIEMNNLYFSCICNQFHSYLPQFIEAVVHGCSVKKVFLEISQKIYRILITSSTLI